MFIALPNSLSGDGPLLAKGDAQIAALDQQGAQEDERAALRAAIADDAPTLALAARDRPGLARARFDGGKTLLMAAAEAQSWAAFDALAPFSDFAARDDKGRTALMRAIRMGSGSEEALRRLLPPSDPLARDENGLTALMWAAGLGNAQAVEALLPVSDPSAVCENGRSAWSLAISAESAGHKRCAQLLAEKTEN